MKKLSMSKVAFIVFVFCAVSSVAAFAQTFTSLRSFDHNDGAAPGAAPVQARDGNLYGTTSGGGTDGMGTVFEITPGGTLKSLYSFCRDSGCPDGESPRGGLIQGPGGNFYGTTYAGGVSNVTCYYGSCGTVFKITPGGTLTTLYSFCSQNGCTDGWGVSAGLIQGTDGNLYGTTDNGGLNDAVCTYGSCGTIFKITPSGTRTTLYNFCVQSACADGWGPYTGLIQATDGNFYGTTEGGGANCVAIGGCGTIFKITPSGTLTTLYSFCAHDSCADGTGPFAALVQAADENFYGTTLAGGSIGGACGTDGCGTVFGITATGKLTTLYRFDSTHGSSPYAGLVQGTDGNFYGTTSAGGANGRNDGTVFRITPSGTLITLHDFCSKNECADGEEPIAGLFLATNGIFYGTTLAGGDYGDGDGVTGTVYSVSVGLNPLVETQPTSGNVGEVVEILGNNLTGTTSVTFNGTVAAFTVVSSTEITATVPAGATTGYVTVTTPSATLTSNKKFRVEP